MIMM